MSGPRTLRSAQVQAVRAQLEAARLAPPSSRPASLLLLPPAQLEAVRSQLLRATTDVSLELEPGGAS